MTHTNNQDDQRDHARLAKQYIVRIKPKNDNSPKWGFPTMKDISENGCYFYTSTPYKVGEILDIDIQIPIMQEPVALTGEVKRIDQYDDIKAAKYGIAFRFINMEELSRQKLIETIKFSLKKQEE